MTGNSNPISKRFIYLAIGTISISLGVGFQAGAPVGAIAFGGLCLMFGMATTFIEGA